ncbi:hypothetical protein [Nonomuraea sp. SYSU D8015]|uniref:hypothetical protein n=1 Tax=Nonomuraea sp. SYSU D8015 TaxID=2593644 RepID=UPI00166112FF|nr:hypothetical protein [Nonomuraea sp. SYSU D8015]
MGIVEILILTAVGYATTSITLAGSRIAGCWAMINVMTRRLTGTSAPTWHGT